MFANDVLKGKMTPVTGGRTGLGHARIVKPTQNRRQRYDLAEG
jgi:hypothetical protein